MSKLAHSSDEETMNKIEKADRERGEPPEPLETVVINIRATKGVTYTYIGRGSIWGNPFAIGPCGTREEVIKKYEEWIRGKPLLMDQLYRLKGQVLGCYCRPAACHGDVLIKLLKEKGL